MGPPAPDAVKRLVDRFDRDRKVSLSGNYKEEQLPEAKTPHEQEALKRTIAATDKAIDAQVYELYALTDQEIETVESGCTRRTDSPEWNPEKR